MESFDQSLKYLLEHEPEDFIRFGLNGEPLEALRPVESALPSRGRDVDGSYLFTSRGVPRLAQRERAYFETVEEATSWLKSTL